MAAAHRLHPAAACGGLAFAVCQALWLVLVGLPLAAHSQPLSRILAIEDEARSRPDLARDKLLMMRAGMSPDDPEQIDLLRVLGEVSHDLGQTEQAERYAMELDQRGLRLAPARAREDARAAAACLRAELSRNKTPLGQLDTLIDDVLPTLNADSRLGVHLACLLTSAGIKESLGNLEQAIARRQEALRLADALPQHWASSSVRSLMADAYRRAGHLDKAQATNNEARALATQQGDWRSLTEVLLVESILATARGDQKAEMEALQQAIGFAKRGGSVRDEALATGNLSDAYLQRKDYAQALRTAEKALPLAQQAHYREAEILAQLNKGFALIGLDRKAEGVAAIRSVVEGYRRSNEVVEMAEVMFELGGLLEEGGHWADAYTAYREYRHYADEVSRQARLHAVLELQESFDAERRHRERALLADENHLKEEALTRSTLMFRLWVLVSALALVLLALAVFFYGRMRRLQLALRSNNEKLKVQGEQDPLTGLANRRHGQALMASSVVARGTLYLLDLDHFKQINDTYGHAAGDVVLIEVARRLKAVLRENDRVYRWGGEEFLILVRSSTPEQTDLLAQRLLQSLAALPVVIEQRHLAVTASIGYADFPLAPGPLELQWDQALDLVDAAMYLAKTQGRNRACGIRHLSAHNTQELQALMQDFEGAWRRGGMTLIETAGLPPMGSAS
ncbi:GGDEF domain-containing protein [Ideonella paludis]|uniref:diguanylate cyclase n=1 Tax=Ideonella paludis TaxID=1233411 RepID=A0ABS5E0R5_9BURK|nr:GGDEF domain-containing protein [Ideonella paludis]MBQ0937005.1 diguanylate cyclase [Ideonella paludis]